MILKQVKRVPEQGPIHLVEASLQVNEFDATKVKMTCRIDGQRFPPPSPHWWTKEFDLLLAQRKAARDGAKESKGSSERGSEEPEVKKRKPNEAVAAQKPGNAATATAAPAPAAKPAALKPVATSAEKPPVVSATAATPATAAAAPVASTPAPTIPAV